MAGTGKKGYTGVTSDGRVISNGIIQSGSSSSRSSSSGPGGSSNYGARVSAEKHENGQPKYVYTSSGKAVPTYGYRVVQGGSDGKMYDINNGRISPMGGGSTGSPAQVIGGSSGGSAKDLAYNLGGAVASAVKGASGGGGGNSGGRYNSSGSGGYGGRDYGLVDPETQALHDKLTELEANKPGAYVNQYEGQIKNILDGILNRKAFDINTDPNYGKLYDLYSQHYQQNASRAARDAMGQLAGMTGGYGSTYGQTVGTQAYDNIMQGLNDNDINLMNLAYGIYQDDRNFDLNKMNTLRGLESSDYNKYRDTVGDYYNDLNHYTNRYNTAWGNDYQLNRDSINDARYEDELAYAREQDALNRALAEEERDYERAWAEDDRAYSRNNSAFQNALSLAKAGYDPSGYLSDNGYNGSNGDLLRGIAAQVQAANAVTGSGGGSGSGRKSSGGSSSGNAGRYSNTSLTWQDVEALRQDKNTSSKTTSAAYSLLSDAEKAKYLANHKSR